MRPISRWGTNVGNTTAHFEAPLYEKCGDYWMPLMEIRGNVTTVVPGAGFGYLLLRCTTNREFCRSLPIIGSGAYAPEE